MSNDKILNGLTEAETTATASVAGLSVGPVSNMPVVVTIERMTGRAELRWFHDAAFDLSPGLYALTPRAPAQAIIDALHAEVARLERERDQWQMEYRFMQSQSAESKAKQVADVETVMRLVDAYTDLRLERQVGNAEGLPVDRKQNTFESNAAREALRAYLTKDLT